MIRYSIEKKQLNRAIQRIEKQTHREVVNSVKRALRGIGKSDTKKLKTEQLTSAGRLNVKSKAVRKSVKYKVYGRNLEDIELSHWIGWKASAVFQTGGTIRAGRKLMPIFFEQKLSRRAYKEGFKTGRLVTIKAKTGELMIFDNASRKYIGVFKSEIRQKKRLFFYENHEANQSEHARILDSEFEKGLQKLMDKL